MNVKSPVLVTPEVLVRVVNEFVLVLVIAFVAALLTYLGAPAAERFEVPHSMVSAALQFAGGIIAVLVVAGGNFSDPDVLVICMVGALLMLVGLMITAGELGKRVPVDDNR